MLAFLLLACAPAQDDTAAAVPAEEDTASDPVSGGAEADGVYARDVLHEIVITLAPADWDTLRFQTRSFYSLLSEGCMEGPWESPYTYVSAEATVDGEALGEIGLRKKGLIGSLSTTRPSLKIDVDHYQDGARYHGLEKLVLNNNNQDPGRLRTCLAHDFFADAGLVAPRCAMAHVTVNGEDLGIYSQTENLDEDLVARRLGAEPPAMYEGTLSDFREGWTDTFDPETGASDGHELHAVVDALAAPDDEVLAALDQVVDLDAFYTFWAAESLAGHWDGYNANTNNFYTYAAPSDGRLRFIASGPDSAFDSREPFGAGQPIWVAEGSALSNRLLRLPEAKSAYEAELERLLDDVWDEDGRLAELDALADVVSPVDDADVRAGIAATRSVMAHRASDVAASMGTRVDVPELRGWPCFTTIGHAVVQFSTTYASYPDGDVWGGGAATTDYVFNDVAYPSTGNGVSIGEYGDGRLFWLTISEVAPGTYVAPYVIFWPDQLVAGVPIRVDGESAEGAVLYLDDTTGGNFQTIAYLGGPSLTFSTVGDTPGAPVTGTLDMDVLGSAG